MSVGVAHAKPPPAGPSPVCYGGKGTPDLGSPSWSVRLGQACWGSCGRGVDEGRMTSNRNLKRRVRARAAKTGESYAAALRHVCRAQQADTKRLDVDGVLISTGPGQTPGGTAAFATQAQAHAAANSLWVSFAMAAQHSAAAPSGTITPDGRWAAQCPGDGHPAVAIADIDNRPESIGIAVAQARPWRRLARAGAYDAHLVTDDRSGGRGAF